MLENFFILQRGNCVFLKNCNGKPLPLNVVMGLSSCISMLLTATRRKLSIDDDGGSGMGMGLGGGSDKEEKSKTSASNLSSTNAVQQGKPCSISVNNMRLLYVELGPLTLVAQGPADEPDEFLSIHCRDVQALLLYYLGQFHQLPSDTTLVASIKDLIDNLLERYAVDISNLVHGVRWVYLDTETREQLDRMLATVEENDNVYGSLLVLGGSVVHGRLSTHETRMALHNLDTRPLGPRKVRALPVYVDGVWKHLIIYRLRNLVLIVSCSLRVNVSQLMAPMQVFEESLAEATIQLPIEEPPVLLRHYTGHDTIAFLHIDNYTGVTIAPPPRPGPASERNKTMRSFGWFYSRACQLLSNSYMTETILYVKGYRFYAKISDGHKLFVLYSDRVQTDGMEALNKEILENVARHAGETQIHQ